MGGWGDAIVRSVAEMPDGKLLAAAGTRRLYLFDVSARKLLHEAPAPPDGFWHVWLSS